MSMKQYKPIGRIVMRRIGEDTLLVPVSGPLARGRVYPLNETAASIWYDLTAGKTVCEAATSLSRRFVVSEADALADAQACVDELIVEGLLETR